MQTKDFVQFKKERTLGDIITDSFKFIRNEWKAFFWMVFKTSVIPFIFFIIAFIFYFNSIWTSATDSYNDAYGDFAFDIGSMVVYVLIMVVSGILSYILMHLSSLYYIKEYIENDGEVRTENLWQFIQEKFWPFLGLSILILITAGVSFGLCLLPILYTWPVLTLMPVIYIFSNQGAADTFGSSWNYVSGKHWADTWGIMFVIALLVMVLGFVFSIPSTIYQVIETLSGVENEDPTQIFDLFSDPIYIGLLLISYLGRFLLQGVTLVSNVLIYYDIDEQKNATGTMEQIDSLGS